MISNLQNVKMSFIFRNDFSQTPMPAANLHSAPEHHTAYIIIYCLINTTVSAETVITIDLNPMIISSTPSLHSHLSLQLPQLFLLIIFLHRLPSPMHRYTRQSRNLIPLPINTISNRYGASLQHLVIQLFLLQPLKFLFQFVFVNAGAASTLSECFGNFLADGVLFAKVFPGRSLVLVHVS